MVVEYNGTNAAGGDSLTEDLNIFYDVSLCTQHSSNETSELTKCNRLVTLLG